MNIAAYFESLRSRILTDSFIADVDILRERNRSKNGHFRARLTFSDNGTLEFSEYVEQNAAEEIALVTYSYHWADTAGNLLRRWDNALHHPNLPNFPHHTHNGETGDVTPGNPINLFSVLDEIATILKKIDQEYRLSVQVVDVELETVESKKVDEVVVLYRPVGPKDLELIAASGYRKWPPRLPEQPIFYPVTNETYAREISERWNVQNNGAGFVTRFQVKKGFMDKYEIHQVGRVYHTEWWIPADDLDELNANIVGVIEVIGEYK
jgi:hypothetical protein